MLNGVAIMSRQRYEDVYGAAERQRLASLLSIPDECFGSTEEAAAPLSKAEVLVTGWGAPVLDETFLDRAPNLKLVLYGAGSVRGIVTDAFWQRGIRLCTARSANAVPVSEFTLGAILLSLKHFWQLSREVKNARGLSDHAPVPGAFDSTVGLVSLGSVGALVLERLRTFDVRVLVYDPFADSVPGAELASLETIFASSDVVSLHTPWLPETVGMIRGEHFASMKPGATFINTARGAVVNEPEMIAALEARPDIQAILDVTYPEPPVRASRLYDLPNVTLTPHIGGALDTECQRLGRAMVDELERYVSHEPLRYEVTEGLARTLA